MPNRSSKPKRPRDLNLLAKSLVDSSTGSGDNKPEIDVPVKNLTAIELGRLGGKKGGLSRAKKLSAEERQDIARHAAKVRWSRKPNKKSNIAHRHTMVGNEPTVVLAAIYRYLVSSQENGKQAPNWAGF